METQIGGPLSFLYYTWFWAAKLIAFPLARTIFSILNHWNQFISLQLRLRVLLTGFLNSGNTYEYKNGYNLCQRQCCTSRDHSSGKKVCSMFPGSIYGVATQSCYFVPFYTYKMCNCSCFLCSYSLLSVFLVPVFCFCMKKRTENGPVTDNR